MELLVQNLSKQFGDKTVLECINFDAIGSSSPSSAVRLRQKHPAALIASLDQQPAANPGGWILVEAPA